MKTLTVTLTGREIAILACVLSRCEGWDTPQELERFLNVAADQVRPDGFTEAEMVALHEKLAEAWDASHGRAPGGTREEGDTRIVLVQHPDFVGVPPTPFTVRGNEARRLGDDPTDWKPRGTWSPHIEAVCWPGPKDALNLDALRRDINAFDCEAWSADTGHKLLDELTRLRRHTL